MALQAACADGFALCDRQGAAVWKRGSGGTTTYQLVRVDLLPVTVTRTHGIAVH